MKKAKHLFLSVLLVSVCFTLTVAAAALRIGDIVGYVQATDIRAFYDGYEMPVYNIDGHVSIVAEELSGYGFSVEWNEEARTLSLRRISDSITSPSKVSTAKKAKNGMPIMPVLHTDIVTYLDGKEIQSYNIDGKTVIRFDALAAYGNFVYDDGARLALISTKGYTFETETIDKLPSEIPHAGGALGAYTGTNSLESLNNSHYKGYRILELDFVLSSDGIPVALHGWSADYAAELSETPITAEEFSKIKILGLFTSLTLDSLTEWMTMHPGTYIITDVKDDNLSVLRTIAALHPEMMNRFIPQIYQYDEYAPVRAMGYSNIIFTLYSLPSYEDKVERTAHNITFAKKNGILAVTADVELANEYANFIDKYKNADVPLYVHTVNDPSEKQELFASGISGVYTDFVE